MEVHSAISGGGTNYNNRSRATKFRDFLLHVSEDLHGCSRPNCTAHSQFLNLPKNEDEYTTLWLLVYNKILNSVYANIKHDSVLPQQDVYAHTIGVCSHSQCFLADACISLALVQLKRKTSSPVAHPINKEPSCPQETINSHFKVCDGTFTEIFARFLDLIICFYVWL